MKFTVKNLLITLLAIPMIGCASTLEKAQKTADEYNTQLQTYMDSIHDYNESAKALNDGIKAVNDELDSCQTSINKYEKAFDPETLTALKKVMVTAQEKLTAEAEVLPEYEKITVNESDEDEALKSLIETAETDMKAMSEITVPEPVEVIDYSETLASLKDAHQTYEDSILSLKQITAPTDEFVMNRLRGIENITAMDAVTEDNDPNGKLHKAGGYIGTVYYRASRIDQSMLYPANGSVIEVGTEGGGAVEIYPNAEDAAARDDYLSVFDGSAFSSGSHHVYGTIIIRTSDMLTASQQNEMTERILNALIEIYK